MKLLVCLLVLATLVTFAASPDVSGKWSGTFTPETGDGGSAYLVLKQNGSAITGTAGPSADQQWAIQSAKISGNTVTVEVKDPDSGAVYKCTMTLSGNKMAGDIDVAMGDQKIKAKIDLTKVD
jgi:uncharacterized protein (DUF2147 family)